MASSRAADIVVTGLGIVSPVGQGKAAFADALLEGRHGFDVMRRPGRQWPTAASDAAGVDARESRFLGAELPALELPVTASRSLLRTASLSAHAALVCVHEAWEEAKLGDVDPWRIALVVGGSNIQQREQVAIHDAYRGRLEFLRPSYGLSALDTDLCGVCSEAFGIRGAAFTIGGASASGLLAVLQACDLLESGRVDACIAVGALMDLSYWECQGFRALGAMGSDRFATEPARACRPFDRDRDGFIFGECSGAVVLEAANRVERRAVLPYARVIGRALRMDAHRNPDPSVEGEVAAIEGALRDANVSASSIDYVNCHGTGSPRGDETELEAIHRCGLERAHLNATKSITGHGLSAAGAVELVATLLQMRGGRLHVTRNLENPIDERCQWVRGSPVSRHVSRALKLSMGFGGINAAICLERC